MRVLILWSDDKSANLGVRVLASGTAALVTRIWPYADVVYQNFGQRNPHLPIGRIRSIVRERLTNAAGMKDWLAGFDLIVDTRAGDSFADIYGIGRLRTMSAVSEFASEAGTPVVLGPQTIGPFTTRQGRAIGRFSMKRAALTMARDSASAEYAKSLGRPVDVLTTDVVFALPVPQPAAPRDVLLNISGLLWQESPHVDATVYRETVTALYRELTARGRRVSLLAHVLESPSADNDVPAIRAFVESVAPTAEVIVPADLAEVRSVIAGAGLVIGSRMHACLNALSVGTPAVPLAYSRKFAPLLGDLGWGHSVDLRSEPDPTRAVMESLDTDLGAEVAAVGIRAQELLGRAETALETVA
ncbi:polysaccharide pyruvyl transferase family protein [Galbitalea soli]|uniref:Polysaccharide pyruvyl transferase family protein n=1 Tax=Galbitalea soli TaxID=1268042 RepID=A0A7C9PLB7_9MICO|nr:polysaccharide pyruvyl transferase family protein [Galbitalea soli]NEM89967.1 polysaccharide pyruvyl transferase family protein [Galbitalea soli]NYJ30673.1 polysaccharide pyruvyl transferase WcaK-like protein [Galbitalea soli]